MLHNFVCFWALMKPVSPIESNISGDAKVHDCDIACCVLCQFHGVHKTSVSNVFLKLVEMPKCMIAKLLVA